MLCGFVQEVYPLSVCLSVGKDFVTLSHCFYKYRNASLKLDRHFAITISSLLPHPSSPNPFLEMIVGGEDLPNVDIQRYVSELSRGSLYDLGCLDCVSKCPIWVYG